MQDGRSTSRGVTVVRNMGVRGGMLGRRVVGAGRAFHGRSIIVVSGLVLHVFAQMRETTAEELQEQERGWVSIYVSKKERLADGVTNVGLTAL